MCGTVEKQSVEHFSEFNLNIFAMVTQCITCEYVCVCVNALVCGGCVRGWIQYLLSSDIVSAICLQVPLRPCRWMQSNRCIQPVVTPITALEEECPAAKALMDVSFKR